MKLQSAKYKLISHEVPLELMLQEQDNISDYLYILLHIAMRDPVYLEYAINYKKNGGIVYLDNSCFELGESLDSSILYEYYQKINPDVVILPDKLGFKEDTIKRSLSFIEQYPSCIQASMPVIQGNSFEEMVECYKEFSKVPDLQYIAIPFVYSWIHRDPFLQASERVKLISFMNRSNIIDKNIKHHLLGTWLPQEFIHYRGYSWIYSVDTSSPIMSAIENIHYTSMGLQTKPKTNLDMVYSKKIEDINLKLMYNNINQFRYFVNGNEYDENQLSRSERLD